MQRTILVRYALAAVTAGLAALVQMSLAGSLHGEAAFATYLFAVASCAWALGAGPALLATLASGAAAMWLTSPPPSGPPLALFLVLGAVLAVFGGAGYHASVRLARAAADGLARERELERQRQQQAVTLASIGDAVITTDVSGHVTYMNPVACALTGWSQDEACGRALDDVFQVVDEHTRERVPSCAREVLETGRLVGHASPTVLVARGGRELAVDDSAAPIREPGAAVAGVVLTFRDVTERRQVAADLAALAAIVGDSEDAIFSMSLAGEIQSWNAAAARLYGYEEKEIVGRDVFVLVPEDQRAVVANALARLTAGAPAEHVETWALRKAQTRVEVSLRISPIRDALGGLRGASAIVRDITERKRSERALERSEQQLADFFDNAAIGLHWVGPDGVILRVNRAELAMLGYAEHEYVGRHIAELHVDRAVIDDILARLLAGEMIYDEPARMRCKDGSIVDVRMHSSALFEHGQLVHTRCFTRDVTAQVRAERALKENEERLRLALEAGHMGSWEYTPATGRVVWSPSLELIHGIAQGSFPGTLEAFLADIHPDDRERVLARIARTLEDGEDHSIEYRIVRPDGMERWVEGRGKLFRDAEGRAGSMRGICVDVTDRVRRERAARVLADASAELADLVDGETTLQRVAWRAVPELADWCSVHVAQPDGSLRHVAVAHVDPAKVAIAEEIYRRYPLKPDAPLGAPRVLRTGEPECVPEVPAGLAESLARDAEHLRLLRVLGIRSYIAVPVRARGRTHGVIAFGAAESGRRYDEGDLAIARDLASRAAVALENAALYAELRERDQRKDEFLATLSHELRNPLAPIRNGVALLRLAPNDEGIRDRALGLLERQVTQLVRLVDDLLDASRITLGKLALRRERVALSDVLESALETSRPLIEAAGQSLVVQLPGAPIMLDADLMRLGQVFANLLTNASKYTPKSGHIQLRAELEPSHVVVRVIDDGAGISADALPRIFEMFTQAPSSEDVQGGLGIGLSLVRALVELHGGEVSARSAGLGRGSELSVRLPLAGVEGDAYAAANAEPAAAARPVRRKILVVDDNVDAALTLQMLLEMQGHEVRTAHDGVEALQVEGDFAPELVLLDLGLPRLSGYDVAARIRARPGRQPMLVAVTGWGQDEDRRRSHAAGFDQHFAKPVRLEQLTEVLAALP